VSDIVGAAQIDQAEEVGVLTKEEADNIRKLDAARMEFVHVDDFAYNEIAMKLDASHYVKSLGISRDYIVKT